jgi:hypothetical protein
MGNSYIGLFSLFSTHAIGSARFIFLPLVDKDTIIKASHHKAYGGAEVKLLYILWHIFSDQEL